MGAACAADGSADTNYLHRLILIYQLISKDEALKAALANHGLCASCPVPPQQYEEQGPLGCLGVPCRFCDARLQQEAFADVSTLRKHVLSASAGSTFVSESRSSASATSAPCSSPAEPGQQRQRRRRGPSESSNTASTVSDVSQQHSPDSPSAKALVDEGSVPVSSASTAEPLVFAYDPRTGTAIPHSPAGIASHSSGAPSSPLGPLGAPCCASPVAATSRGPTARAGRIFVDGVFDLLHSGHFNALRQARQLGRSLVVGVNSDIETYAAKGCWPIYTQEERAEIVASCKWVDEVVVGTPYEVSTQLLDTLACEAAAHGDDWVVGADGRDAYAEPRKVGRMRIFKRTEGVSSTNITRRLLEATAHMCEQRVAVDRPQSVGHFARQALQGSVRGEEIEEGGRGGRTPEDGTDKGPSSGPSDAYGASQRPQNHLQVKLHAENTVMPCMKQRQSDWNVFMSSKRLLQFIGEAKKPKPGDRVVYVDGSFDVLHVGHVRILKIAKEMGDYLIVGIHVKGPGFPVMNVNERALNVLAMRMVDEVIIGAPWKIPLYLLQTFGIHMVVRGTRIDCIADPLGDVLRHGKTPAANAAAAAAAAAASGAAVDTPRAADNTSQWGIASSSPEPADDPYRVPKELGIYREVESFSSWTTKELVTRLIRNRQALSDSLQHR
ncbi:hypothetical protein ACSSS7_003834 [Eimeria intestinalis]